MTSSIEWLKAQHARLENPEAAEPADLTAPCPICGYRDGRSLSWDHDHKTGNFRGYICRNCNLALGLLKDDIATLKRAVRYLRGTLRPRRVARRRPLADAKPGSQMPRSGLPSPVDEPK